MTGLTRLEISMIARSPLRIDGVGIDVCRDWAERPCIPAAMVKGQIREQARRLALALAEPICEGRGSCAAAVDRCLLCRLFGAPGYEGAVAFSDLLSSANPVLIDRPRTAQSRTRRVALPVESRQVLVIPPDSTFDGVIRHRLGTVDSKALALLLTALHAGRQWGTGGALGWGQCEVKVRGVLFESALLTAAFGPAV